GTVVVHNVFYRMLTINEHPPLGLQPENVTPFRSAPERSAPSRNCPVAEGDYVSYNMYRMTQAEHFFREDKPRNTWLILKGQT
ncbi:MAG: hypothetical protein ACLFT2_06750, partial [Candidatus Brocadiia bacterium]